MQPREIFEPKRAPVPWNHVMYTSRVEKVDAQDRPCGRVLESKNYHVVAACELYKRERDVFEEDKWEVSGGGMRWCDNVRQ